MIEKILEKFEELKTGSTDWAEDTAFDIAVDKCKEIVQEVAKEYMHSCYDCEWECLDGCSLRRDSNGNTEPVYDGLTDCKDFVPIAPYQKGE